MSKSPSDTEQPGFLKSAKEFLDSLLAPLTKIPKPYQPVAYGLVIIAVLIIGVTYLLVNSGVITGEWLVIVVIALLLTLIVIAMILRPQMTSSSTPHQKRILSGHVVDGDGNRVAGAEVWIANDRNQHMFADPHGEYHLNVDPKLPVLEITAAKEHLLKTIDISPAELEKGVVRPITLVPDPKTENRIILEALQETEETLGKHLECITNVIKPVEEKPSGLAETIKKFTELVERESNQGEDSFSNKYAKLVYGILYNYKGKLKAGELKTLLSNAIDEVQSFQFAAYTYDSHQTKRKLEELGQCWEYWNTNGGRDSQKIESAHKALADSIEGILQENAKKQDGDKAQARKERWEQDLQKFRDMSEQNQEDIAALVKEWAGLWIEHVKRTRHYGYLITAKERFTQAVEQEKREPAKIV